MHGDHAVEALQGIGETCSQLFGDVSHLLPDSVEVRLGSLLPPVEVQFSVVAQPHPPVGDVATHAEQGEQVRGELGRAEQARHLRPDVGFRLAAQELVEQASRDVTPELPYRLARNLHGLHYPVDEIRVSGVFYVEAPPLAAVLPILKADAARDYGPVPGVDQTRHLLAIFSPGGIEGEGDQVSVAAKATAELVADTAEGIPVLHLHLKQQEGGAQAPGREDQPVRGERLPVQAGGIRPLAFPLRLVPHVADLVPSALSGFELLHLAPRQDLGPQPLGLGEVIVVERVLGPVVAADVALADQAARVARTLASLYVPEPSADGLARSRLLALVAEGDGQVGQPPVEAKPISGIPELFYLGHLVVRWLVDGVLLGVQHLLDPVVVGVELGAGHRPVLEPTTIEVFLYEPLLGLADQDVRVDQGPPAKTAADHRPQLAERPDVVHPVQPLAGVPDVLLHPMGGAGKLAWRVRLPPLQDADAQPLLGQPVGRHRTAEPGTDDYRVEVSIARGIGHNIYSFLVRWLFGE